MFQMGLLFIPEWERIYIVNMSYLINCGYLDYMAYTNDSYIHKNYQQHFFFLQISGFF